MSERVVSCTVAPSKFKSSMLGTEIEGLTLTCTECGQAVRCYGREPEKIQNGLVRMRSVCPTGQSNRYQLFVRVEESEHAQQ